MQDWFSANAPWAQTSQPAQTDWFAPPKPTQPTTPTTPPAREKSAVERYLGGALSTLDPRPLAELYQKNPTPSGFAGNLVLGLLGSQWDQLKKAKESYDKGQTSEAIGHALAGVVPVVGPAAAHAGERMGEGDIAGGMGEATMLLGPMAAASRAKRPILNRPAPNPVATEALNFGDAQGIPIDAATRTQSPQVASAQQMIAANPGGAGTAERFRAGQQQSLAQTGQQLAGRTSTGPQTAESAGTRAISDIERVIGEDHATATEAYDRLRELERASPQEVYAMNPDGSKLRAIRMAVDLRPVKAGLQGLYQGLMKKREIAGTLQGAEARAAVALDALMNAPEAAPLSVVDAALGDLKGLARGAE